MNTRQVNAYLNRINNFVGTFPCNFIPDPKHLPAYYVVNLSRYSPSVIGSQGSHWVAIVVKNNKRGIYFDCSGMPPCQDDVVNFLEQHCPLGVTTNNQTIQNPTSDVCGVYCIDFITAHAKGISLRRYLQSFSSSFSLNDQTVVDRVTCQSSTLPQRSQLNLKTLL